MSGKNERLGDFKRRFVEKAHSLGKRKTVVGAGSVGRVGGDEHRKVGDTWTDSEGNEWEQKQGYRLKKGGVAVGLFARTCKSCKKPCTTSYDVDTWKRQSKCYHCQIEFELDLKGMRIGENGNKWNFWVKLQHLNEWMAMDKLSDEIIEEKSKEDDKKIWDHTMANMLANNEIAQTMEKNKKLTGGRAANKLTGDKHSPFND